MTKFYQANSSRPRARERRLLSRDHVSPKVPNVSVSLSTFCLKCSTICPLQSSCPHVSCPQSLPFALFVLQISSHPSPVTVTLSHSPTHPTRPPLPDTSLLSGCVYLPLHSAVFTASIHLCLFSTAAPSYINSGRDITHTRTYTHTMCKRQQHTDELGTAGMCFTGSTVSQKVCYVCGTT